MAVERRGRPGMNTALADHRCRYLEHDCRDIPPAEEVLAVLPSLGGEAVLLRQCSAKFSKRLGIAGEKIGCQARERFDAVWSRNPRARLAGRDKLAFKTLERFDAPRK